MTDPKIQRLIEAVKERQAYCLANGIDDYSRDGITFKAVENALKALSTSPSEGEENETMTSEELAQLSLDLGFDTSGCYDLDDIKTRIANGVEQLRDDLKEHESEPSAAVTKESALRVSIQVNNIGTILDEWIREDQIDCRGDENCDHCALMMHVRELERLALRSRADGEDFEQLRHLAILFLARAREGCAELNVNNYNEASALWQAEGALGRFLAFIDKKRGRG